ncbi:lipopolysaccharide biosynthesis protein [Halosimplex aquaticum]|uniref:Lipopolysaccharide biosynthesis protein n=1 Tax=Halosimplex aquaticum TaxID=3026162 RepID=A0ABD5Y7Z6_9EURY|nr:lipopolysaccharide biosynthesis protein [Halosimplex aquaticum]
MASDADRPSDESSPTNADSDVEVGDADAGQASDGSATAGAVGAGSADAAADEPGGDPVEARLDDALERVAHGATVSVPSILVQRGLTVAFTAVLTNGFAAGTYGVFAVARRLQQFLLHLALGFRSGLSRFLPNADSAAERDAIVTVAALLLGTVATLFGAALFLGAPMVTEVADQRPLFTATLRVFAVGLPATVWLFTATEVLRGLEEVVPLNLALRVGFPAAQLAVGVVGTVVYGDLVAVAIGVVAVSGLVGLGATAWLVRERGLGLRVRGVFDDATEGDDAGTAESDGAEPTDGSGEDLDLRAVWRRYVGYTIPLFVGGFATTIQRLGFYPLIALYLTDVAGGVFAVGMVVGTLVRLPLIGLNQFVPPVAAALHEDDHRAALARFYHVTSRLVLVGVVGLAIPVIVYRETVMSLFGPAFVPYSPLLVGFVLAQFGACAVGSVGILLMMTDNQRAYLVVNVCITLLLAAVAVPLTIRFGLAGVVASYVLMLTLNNGLEVAVLYHFERLQPFTWLHGKPLVAAVPLGVIAWSAKALLSGPAAPVVGVAAGLSAYAAALWFLGFTPAEHRLAETLAERYRAVLARS